MADIDVKEIFSSNGSLAEISPSEWKGGWVSIVGGIHGRPTAQQFNRVFNVLHLFIANNHKSIESVKKTADGAVQSDCFTGDTILSKLLEVDGSGSGLDSDKLDGRDGSYYAKETESVHTYDYSYENKTHYFIGSGAIGRVRIMHEFNSGDVIKIGPSKSAAVTAKSFMGVDPVEEFAVDRWYQFVYDKNSKGEYEINFKSGRVKVSYVVNHWKQKSSGDGYSLDSTETFEGIKGKVASPNVKSFDGYVPPSQQNVKLGRNTVIDYYYTCATCEYTICYFYMDVDGRYPASAAKTTKGTAPYGSVVSVTPEAVSGFATPASQSITIKTGKNEILVQYSRNSYNWAITHYEQNVTGSGYDVVETETGTALYGSVVYASPKSYTGFESPSGKSIEIGTQGNTSELYYTRKSYQWTVIHYKQNVSANGYDFAESETGTALYGSTVTPNVKMYTGFTSPETKSVTIGTGENVIRLDYNRNKYRWVAKHFQQNVSGSGYSLVDTDTGISTYGATVVPNTRSYEGFTSPGKTSFVMDARDAEISYQYSRNQYDVVCIDVCGGTELGRGYWKAYYGSTAYGSSRGSNGNIDAYYSNYGYTGCSNAAVGTGGATVYRYFDLKRFTVGGVGSNVYNPQGNAGVWKYGDTNYTSQFTVRSGSHIEFVLTSTIDNDITSEHGQESVAEVLIFLNGHEVYSDGVSVSGNYRQHYGNSRRIGYTFSGGGTAQMAVRVKAKEENVYTAAYGSCAGWIDTVTCQHP